jgi:hypothetical protein
MSPPDGRDDESALASLDGLGDSHLLRAQAEQQLRASGGEVVTARHHQGGDASDSVWVTVDPRGGVESIDISRTWRDRLAVGNLGAAVLEAYTAAVQKALSAAALATLAGDRTATRQPEWAGSDDPGSTWTQFESEVDERRWLAETWDVLDGVDAELHRLTALEAESATIAERDTTLSSPHGYLTVRLRGRGVVDITGDVPRIALADPEQLRLDALAVFRAAQLTGEH